LVNAGNRASAKLLGNSLSRGTPRYGKDPGIAAFRRPDLGLFKQGGDGLVRLLPPHDWSVARHRFAPGPVMT
jgi:hypothetical protein